MKEYRVVTQADRWWTLGANTGGLESMLNNAAQNGWEVKAILHGEHLGVLGLRGGIAVVLEREKPIVAAVTIDHDDDAEYDETKIPSGRYYSDLGRITSALKEAGLVDDVAIARAREHMARRGGHICDHLIAIGAITDERLRQFCREHYEMAV